MSFCFLSDAFPDWAESGRDGVDIFENFGPATAPPTSDKDLLAESFSLLGDDRVPSGFEDESNYYKLFSEDWYKDTTRYRNQQQRPFAEEEQLGSSKSDSTATRDSDSDGKGCIKIAEHLDSCHECRQRLAAIFAKPVVADNSTSTTFGQEVGQLLLLLAIGIFIIFLLDMTMRVGRYLKK